MLNASNEICHCERELIKMFRFRKHTNIVVEWSFTDLSTDV